VVVVVVVVADVVAVVVGRKGTACRVGSDPMCLGKGTTCVASWFDGVPTTSSQ